MQKTYKRRTAKQIIAAKIGETKGGYNISTIAGEDCYWEYRTRMDGNGYVSGDCTVTTPANADCISIKNENKIIEII